MTRFWNPNIKREEIREGDHKAGFIRKLDREWKPVNESERRFKEKILDEVEKNISGVPEFDTGYMYVKIGESYTLNHNLKQIPSRISLFYSDSDEPKFNNSNIYEIIPIIISDIGIKIRHNNQNKCTVTIGDAAVFGSDEQGYIRIQMWR